jgi:hypothetical protein
MRKRSLFKALFPVLALLLVAGFAVWTTSKNRAKEFHPERATQTPAAATASLNDENPLSLAEVAKRSSRIVLAECTSIDVRKSGGGNIFTFIDLRVLQNIKGDHAESAVTLRILGGRLGNQQVGVPSDLKIAKGDKVVVFLGPPDSGGYPIFYSEAVFKVAKNPLDNSDVVLPVPKGVTLFHANNNVRYGETPDVLSLQDFLFSLSKLMK